MLKFNFKYKSMWKPREQKVTSRKVFFFKLVMRKFQKEYKLNGEDLSHSSGSVDDHLRASKQSSLSPKLPASTYPMRELDYIQKTSKPRLHKHS